MTPSTYQLKINEIEVEVVRRKVKHLRLYVRPPDGSVRVVVPVSAPDAFVRHAISAKIEWIRRHQGRFTARRTQSPPPTAEGAMHFVSGIPHRLQLQLRPGPARVALPGSGILELGICPEATDDERDIALSRWYRGRLQEAIPPLIARWEPAMCVQVAEWGIKRMKTRWGSCNTRARRIWLNLELAKRPLECLEYVIVHELAHLLEPSHNARFKGILDQHLPGWRDLRVELNRQPLT